MRTRVLAVLFTMVCAIGLANAAGAVGGNKLHIVFDASYSMCGFLKSAKAQSTMIDLIRTAQTMEGPGSDTHVFLLKQGSTKTGANPIALIPAPTTFLRDSQQVATGNPHCAPFDGVASPLDLVFAGDNAVAKAESLVLITDAALDEDEQRAFVTNWSEWISATPNTPVAGVAVSVLPFSGTYYPIVKQAKKQNGYPLLQHDRPLYLFWAVRDRAHIPAMKKLLNGLQAKQIEQLLPLPASGDKAFAVDWTAQPGISGKIVPSKTPLGFQGSDLNRPQALLASCLRSQASGATVAVKASATCQDGSPIFEGVNGINVHYDFQSPTLFNYTVEVGAGPIQPIATKSGGIAFNLKPQHVNKSGIFKILQQPKQKNFPSMKSLSIDSDDCPGVSMEKRNSKEEAACRDKLNGKTFQIDILLQKMNTFAASKIEAELARRNGESYTVKFSIPNEGADK